MRAGSNHGLISILRRMSTRVHTLLVLVLVLLCLSWDMRESRVSSPSLVITPCANRYKYDSYFYCAPYSLTDGALQKTANTCFTAGTAVQHSSTTCISKSTCQIAVIAWHSSNLLMFTVVDGEHCVVFGLSVHLFTHILHAVISLYFVERFHWNFAALHVYSSREWALRKRFSGSEGQRL